MRVTLVLYALLASCVPYNNQLIDRQIEIENKYGELVQKTKPNKLIFDTILYQEQVEFERYNVDVGNKTTINRLIPKEDSKEILPINIVNDHLVLPINTFKEVHDQSEYILVFNGNYSKSKEQLNVHLILIESRPEKIIWRNTRENKTKELRLYTFDLSPIQHQNSSEIYINLYGLDESIKYDY